jgi:hypothetical protein
MIRLCVFLCALALAGCGENLGERQTRLYGPNAYRIAGDTVPWSNPPYNGDEHTWQIAIDQRARMQNDYLRLR